MYTHALRNSDSSSWVAAQPLSGRLLQPDLPWAGGPRELQADGCRHRAVPRWDSHCAHHHRHRGDNRAGRHADGWEEEEEEEEGEALDTAGRPFRWVGLLKNICLFYTLYYLAEWRLRYSLLTFRQLLLKSHRNICTPEKRFQMLRLILLDFPSASLQEKPPFKQTLCRELF